MKIKTPEQLEYIAEGKRRSRIRKAKRVEKIQNKEQQREYRKQNCCEGNVNCNGTTDCMWY